ncbi:MAG: magnesium/cobalt transporter CorA [Cyclobacteriaceae bacterium]
MLKLLKKRAGKSGLPSGSLVYLGEAKSESININLIHYNSTTLEEKTLVNLENCKEYLNADHVSWFNIDGIHNKELLEQAGKVFGLHSLFLEDIMSTDQRPKFEDNEDCLFVVLNMLTYDDDLGNIHAEQVSFVLGDNFVVSFQEKQGDVFETVRERIRLGKGRIRGKGPDYLLYALIDIIVDNYFIILEKISDRIGNLDDELLENPNKSIVHKIHLLRREMILLRRSFWPLRDVFNWLERGETKHIKKGTRIFFKDVYDHIIRIIETTEIFRDIVGGMMDLHMSTVSNRMNEVMKVLTIISTIFIPLTFIAGIYGMNFTHMPELEWRNGYFMILIIMSLIGLLMLFFFKRKKWL